MAPIQLKLTQKSKTIAPSDKDALITAAQVRLRFGGISDMTLWRWVHDAKMGFPQPTYINKRKFWRVSEIEAFIERQKQGALP